MALGYFGLAFPGSTALYVSLLLIIVANAGTAQLGENIDIDINDFDSVKKRVCF